MLKSISKLLNFWLIGTTTFKINYILINSFIIYTIFFYMFGPPKSILFLVGQIASCIFLSYLNSIFILINMAFFPIILISDLLMFIIGSNFGGWYARNRWVSFDSSFKSFLFFQTLYSIIILIVFFISSLNVNLSDEKNI